MKIVKLGKKEFIKRFGTKDGYTSREKGEEPTVYFPGRASSGEMLHEIYHASISPDLIEIEEGKKWQTPDEFALEELRAEDFSAEKKGRDYISFTSITGIAKQMLDWGNNPAVVMGSITRGLQKLGYEPLDRDYRHHLWTHMKELK